jgi:phospholipid-binding lipoprotein MlaA
MGPEAVNDASFRATAVDPNRGDPLEGFNRAMFGLHQALDKAIYRPVAMGYQHVVPKPVRSGLRNFFGNLTEPVVFLNYLLQFKFGKAAETLARFTVNSTLGVGGFFDIAKTKDFNLPHRNNSFGDTLAYYGVGPGPYLFLPLVGPTTLRDVLGGPLDGAVLPLAIGQPFTDWRYQFSSGAITGLDLRAESDPELRALFGGAVDPYATLRSVWLQNRAAEVAGLRHHRLEPRSPSELDDPLRDPSAPSAGPPESRARELQDPLADPAVPLPAVTPN